MDAHKNGKQIEEAGQTISAKQVDLNDVTNNDVMVLALCCVGLEKEPHAIKEAALDAMHSVG